MKAKIINSVWQVDMSEEAVQRLEAQEKKFNSFLTEVNDDIAGWVGFDRDNTGITLRIHSDREDHHELMKRVGTWLVENTRPAKVDQSE